MAHADRNRGCIILIGYKRGQGSIVIRVKILNSSLTTGEGKTGLTSSSSGLRIGTIADNEAATTAYTQGGSTIEGITTLGTFAAPTATKCRFKEVDATSHKGVYEIQIADARFAVSNAKSLLISISGVTDLAETDVVVPLRDLDPYDAVRGGLGCLPNAAINAAGGFASDVLAAGTATAGGSDSITLQTALGADTRSKGMAIDLIGGTGAGQTRTVKSYVNSTLVMKVTRAWTTNPDNTTVYRVRYDTSEGGGQTFVLTDSGHDLDVRQVLESLFVAMGPTTGRGGATPSVAHPTVAAAGTAGWSFTFNVTTGEKTGATYTPTAS